MNAMDAKHQELLLKHSANPNPLKDSDVALHNTYDDKKPVLARHLTKALSKPSLRDTMLAQKRAKQAAVPSSERPPTPLSMADTTDVSSAQPSNIKAKVTAATSAASKPNPSSLTIASLGKIGSLNSAPMRPLRQAKREVIRPGTADPTQARKPARIDAKPASPRGSTARPRPKSSMAITRSVTKSIASKDGALSNDDSKAGTLSEEHVSTPIIKGTSSTDVAQALPVAVEIIPKSSNSVPSLELQTIPKPSTPVNTGAKGCSHSHPTSPPRTPITPLPEPMFSPPSPLQIYEDPFRNDGITKRAPYNKDIVEALAELDVNYERHQLATPQRLSPERQANYAAWKLAEERENRKSGSLDLPPNMINDHKTIDSCIRAIRARVMDNYGFRALQKIIRVNDLRIWGDGTRFDALLFATIEYLEKPKPSVDVSTQLMITLRIMMRTYHSRFDTYDARVLCALITCRRYYKATHHVVSGIEESCDEIICQTFVPVQCIEAVLDTIETETDDEAGKLSLTLGIYALQLLLERISASKLFGPSDIDTEVWKRLTRLTRKLLIDDYVNVRIASYEFCISVYKVAPAPLAFLDDLASLPADAKALMQYYISRWEKRVAGGLEDGL